MDMVKAQGLLNSLTAEWDLFSTRLQNFKVDELVDDLFSQLDFLCQFEEVRAAFSSQLPELERCVQEMNNQTLAQEYRALKIESEHVLSYLKPKLEFAEESYNGMAEEVLNRCEDHIQELTEKILDRRQELGLSKDSMGFEIDEENELRDLRESLETYREIRLENISEETQDSIIDQLDSEMIACDSALLIDESSM